MRNNDVDPALNPGASYYLEAYYVSTDDAPAGNHANNASWREVVFSSISNVNSIGSTEVEEQAIRKWGVEDPTVEIDEMEANQLRAALTATLAAGIYTPDLGGTATTAEMASALRERLS